MNIPFLTLGEEKVYRSLLSLGETSIGSILKESGVSHSKVYAILERLCQKGLVSKTKKGGRQYFYPAGPKALLTLADQKDRELLAQRSTLLSTIRELSATEPRIKDPVLQSYDGMSAMRSILDTLLTVMTKKDTVYILGSSKRLGVVACGYLRDWQRRRIATGATCFILSNSDAPKWNDPWWMRSKREKKTITKRLPYDLPAFFVICKDRVITIYFSKSILTISITHKEIAESYRQFFTSLASSCS